MVVVSRALAFSLRLAAYLVVITDTQAYNGKLHAYEDFPITDVIQVTLLWMQWAVRLVNVGSVAGQ